MSDVSITYAGIFHVKDDLWRFINTMEDHQKVLVFTINGENNIKSIFRIETSGIQKLLMQIGIPANLLGFSYIVTALELIALNPEYLNNITKGLYADVSEKCSSTPVRVERNIRHAIDLLSTMVDEDSELICLYYGADVSKQDADALSDEIEEKFPECEVEVNFGGQPIYYYMISVE